MISKRNWIWVSTLTMVAVALPASADGADEVPLYTNADLQQFGEPEPIAPPPATTDADRQWGFVHDYLDREYARIDSDRRDAVDRALAEPPETAPTDTLRGYGVYAPGLYGAYYGGGYGVGQRGRGHRDRSALPRYDTRTARHGYFVPAQRRKSAAATGGIRRGGNKRGGSHGGAKRGGGGRRR